jgi:hypothetical protein
MSVPNMGSSRRANLAGALLTPVQERVLALLSGQPERRSQSAEVIRLAMSGPGLSTGSSHGWRHRVQVADLYQRRCAVTAERTLPVLEAPQDIRVVGSVAEVDLE